MAKLKEIYLYDLLGNYIKLKIPIFTGHDLILADAHLPGVIVSKNPRKKGTCIRIIEFLPSAIQKIKKNKKKIQIFDQIDLKVPIYVFHLIYSIFHTHWLKNNIYSVHSTCISLNKYNILLIGHSGFGKTSTSLNLLKNYNFKLVSSDRTLLKINKDGELVPIGGTKVITYKHKDLNINIPTDMLKKGTNYVDRKVEIVSPKYIYDGYPKKINLIAMIRLSNFHKKISNLPPFEILVSLYPYFLDYWNSDALLFGGLEIYDGTNIEPEIKKRTLAELRKLILKNKIISISGPLEYICNELNGLAN